MAKTHTIKELEKMRRVILLMSEFEKILKQSQSSLNAARASAIEDKLENPTTISMIDMEVKACLKDLKALCEKYQIK